ncbi:hypothetical protein [Luteitalea sp.]|uniref:hypothetical protein n=1 Tax=Luteitalea sp. TaxID=2004800 RepID=UPI0025C06013|nr:hypothetical protein [Luteitalea sp.]
MGNSTLRAIAVSIVRAAVAMLGAYLVRGGFVDDSLMQEGASVLAFLVVDRAWEFWLLHRAVIYQRWLLWLGLRSNLAPDDAGRAIQIAHVEHEARERVKDGIKP